MSVYKILILLVFNRECINFCLANHACVPHLLSGQPHLLECYYRNCLIGTHVCTSSIRMIRFFLPFSVNCSQVGMFQILPALCPHGQGERGWSTKYGQAWKGEGGSQKFPNLCGHPLWMTPTSAMTNRINDLNKFEIHNPF